MHRSVWPLVLVLLGLGLGGAAFRSWSIGYPLFPRLTEEIWTARLVVEWQPGQAPVAVLLPHRRQGQDVQDERLLSGPLEPSVDRPGDGTRRLLWRGDGATTATYEAEILIADRAGPFPSGEPDDRWRRLEALPAALQAAAASVAAVLGRASSPRACADLAAPASSPPLVVALEAVALRAAADSPAAAAVACWRAAGRPARVVQAFSLLEGFFTEPERLTEVFTPRGWVLADPARGQFPASRREWLVWSSGAGAMAETARGPAPPWRLELQRERQTLWAPFFRQTAARDALLTRWSLYALPPAVQEVFHVLLIVPLGALVVAVLRNVVGLPTFGTFMPILIAIAFRQTTLGFGLILFVLILGVGYGVRVAIERYRLLLVPRLSAMLTLVILCLAVLSLAGVHLGLRQVLFVGLLPMVILTMTIERFHVVMEESGARAALRTAASTLAVAALTYALIAWDYLRLGLFTYPELLLAVAAGQVALGRYVGLRLSEIWRFRRLAGPA